MKQNDQQKLTALIVDDEELARKGLAMRLEELGGVDVLQHCQNGREAIEAIIEFEPDVVFLDIQMPGMTGFELISEIQGDVMPMVIFVTAYDAFAVDAFDVHAIDYLLKPVEKERLADAISKARQMREQHLALHEKRKLLDLAVSLTGKSSAAIGELLESGEAMVEKADRLAIKDGPSITFVPVHD
ncbi:MAG: response regulator, partial [Gammaproteobacteria bacterium]|nr:response regulator [Gammaproteobacteria bacterium]